jgi:hypothetical protein
MYKYMSLHSFPAAIFCFLFSICLGTLVVLFPYFGCFFCFSCLCCSFFSVSWVISFSFYVLLSIMAESSNTAVLVTSSVHCLMYDIDLQPLLEADEVSGGVLVAGDSHTLLLTIMTVLMVVINFGFAGTHGTGLVTVEVLLWSFLCNLVAYFPVALADAASK